MAPASNDGIEPFKLVDLVLNTEFPNNRKKKKKNKQIWFDIGGWNSFGWLGFLPVHSYIILGDPYIMSIF
jgi:hypothetical protein